jgi:hypothetical protein
LNERLTAEQLRAWLDRRPEEAEPVGAPGCWCPVHGENGCKRRGCIGCRCLDADDGLPLINKQER